MLSMKMATLTLTVNFAGVRIKIVILKSVQEASRSTYCAALGRSY